MKRIALSLLLVALLLASIFLLVAGREARSFSERAKSKLIENLEPDKFKAIIEEVEKLTEHPSDYDSEELEDRRVGYQTFLWSLDQSLFGSSDNSGISLEHLSGPEWNLEDASDKTYNKQALSKWIEALEPGSYEVLLFGLFLTASILEEIGSINPDYIELFVSETTSESLNLPANAIAGKTFKLWEDDGNSTGTINSYFEENAEWFSIFLDRPTKNQLLAILEKSDNRELEKLSFIIVLSRQLLDKIKETNPLSMRLGLGVSFAEYLIREEQNRPRD